MSGWRAIFFAGLLAPIVLVVFIAIGGIRPYPPIKTRNPSSRVDHGLEVTLTYDTGSRGASTFFVHVKNVSDHTVGIRQFLRYYTSEANSSGRNENAFLLCLGQPGDAVPLNHYTTHAINDGFATPIKAGEEQIFEYQMQPGDIDRIGSRDVTACICYYDFDPMAPWDGKPTEPLQAWSAPIKVAPLEWGLVNGGLQVGLQIKDNVATVQVRNVSDQPIQLEPPQDEDSSSRNAFYYFEVLPYSGMYKALHPEKIPTHRYRHELLPLAPGRVLTATYKLTADDLQKLKGAQLRAHCIQLISPIRHQGRVADSNAVALPASWWP